MDTMFNSPDGCTMDSVSTACTQLEYLINQQERIAIGWTHSYCCIQMDEGDDPRLIEVPELLKEWEESE